MQPTSKPGRQGPNWFGRPRAKGPDPPGKQVDAPGVRILEPRSGQEQASPPGAAAVSPPQVATPRAGRKPAPRARHAGPAIPALTTTELARLAALGIHPMALAGRLRLVLPVGCGRDFTQTRAILRTGGARDGVEAAIQALMERGARCDCEVFQALGEPPRCVLWHQPAARVPGEA